MMEVSINMNYEEEKAVEKLKMLVKDDLTPTMREDVTLYYRFLTARDFNIDKAEKLLRKNITWRKIHQVDTMLQNFKPDEFFVKMAAPSFVGFDKDGDSVLYSPCGNFSIFELYKSMKLNNIIKHLMWFSEKQMAILKEHSNETGNCRYRTTVIFDVDNLTFRTATSKLTLNLFLRIVDLMQENFPEILKWVYVINAPSYLIYLYSILKTAMASKTVSKIRICSNDIWKESLLDLVDADVLPAFLGGNRTDPDGDPRCRSFISPGGKIPEKYFLTDKDRYFQNGAHVTKMTLPNQEKKEIRVDIQKAGFLLEWEFLTRDKDVGFGVFFQDAESNIQEVIPIERYETSDGTEKDSYKCHSAGTYIIVFDNTYSWLSSKRLEYSINVRKPSV